MIHMTTYRIAQIPVTAAELTAAQGGYDPTNDQTRLTVRLPADYDPETITAADVIHDDAITVVHGHGTLFLAQTGEALRPATPDEAAASDAADETGLFVSDVQRGRPVPAGSDEARLSHAVKVYVL